ncbi:MAG TPA: hypothetical protein VNO32_48860 [Candidatus Acidoferrum sp.]|nr:hypothetical protein [Candidatus Acidoferrum sp.]
MFTPPSPAPSCDLESFADLDGHCCVLEGAAEGAELGSVSRVPIGEIIGAALGAGIGALAGSAAADYALSHPDSSQSMCGSRLPSRHVAVARL